MVASGKDGVGKSTLSVFIGAALAAKKQNILVLELDNGLRSIDVVSGTYGKLIYDINDALSGKIEPRKAIAESPVSEHLFVMSAPYNPSMLPVEEFIKLTTALSENFDHIIIDTAATPGALYTAASCAMRGLIVATADPVGVRNAKHVKDQLDEYQLNDVRLIINRVVPGRVQSGIVPNLDFVIDSVGAQLIGVIPELSDIAMAAAGVAALPKTSLASRVFRNIAERMDGNDVPLLVQ